MSQVQPPRTRHSHHRPETISLLRLVIVNLGTLTVTALLLRAAVMITVPDTTQRGLHLLSRATYLIVWPLMRVSPLRHVIHGDLTLADLATIALLVTGWLILLGIVAGWEHEGQRQRVGTSQTGLRP